MYPQHDIIILLVITIINNTVTTTTFIIIWERHNDYIYYSACIYRTLIPIVAGLLHKCMLRLLLDKSGN